MRKSWKYLLALLAVLLLLQSCGKPAKAEKAALPTIPKTEPTETQPEERGKEFYCGTWKLYSVEIEGVAFTAEQLKALSGEKTDSVCLVLTSDGLAYLVDGTQCQTGLWTTTSNGIRIDKEELPYTDDKLKLEANEAFMLFAKTSDDQIPPETIPPTEPPTETTEPEKPTGIRPEFQEAMDAYEAFYDEYCELMQQYKKNPSDLSLLGKYMDMLSKVADMDEKFEAWNQEDMTNEELKYYLDVTARIEKKMIDLF